MDPLTRTLTQAAEKVFSTAEKKTIRKLADDLRAAQATLSANDATALARLMQQAQLGQDAGGKPITAMQDRIENVRQRRLAIDLGPLLSAEAIGTQGGVWDAGKPLARRLLEAGIAHAEFLLGNPPAMPLPSAFVEWELGGADLDGIFHATLTEVRRALAWELEGRVWGQQERWTPFGWLDRAGLTTTEK